MVRHHGGRDRRRGSARHHGDGRNGDQYIDDPSPRGVGHKTHSKANANYGGRTPTSRPPKAPKKNSTANTSGGRDQPPMADGAFGDSAPHPKEAANELRDIGTESFTNYDASKYDDASSYVGGDGDHRGRIQSKYSEESDRLMVVSTMSHMASPDFNKLRGLTSKNGRHRGHHNRDRSYGGHGHGRGGGRMPSLNEDASASFIEDESAYGGTNYTGYSDAYSRGGYSSVLSKDTGITDYSSVLSKDTGITGYTSVGTGLTEDYTRDDDTGYDTGYDSRFTADTYSAYTDDRTNPNTNHLMREVKKEMKEMRRDWREEKRDMKDNFEDVQICDFSVLQKQIDKLVSKGKVSLVAMINDKLNMGTGSKSPRGRGARRREAWDEHLKNLDHSQIVQNESDLVSSASFTPSLGVVVDFDDNDGQANAGAPRKPPPIDVESAKEDDTALVSGISYDEPSRLDSDDGLGAKQPAPRPPTPPAPHNTEAAEATTSPKHTTPESHVMIKGGQMSVINPSADEDGDYIRSTKAALRKVGSGVAYFFHSGGTSIADESVEVEASGKGTVVGGTELISNEHENQSPNGHLLKYANRSNDSVGNETSTTTVTLIKPSPSTSSLLKTEVNINGPVYQGPASGLPKETQQLPQETQQSASSPSQHSITKGAKNDEPSTCESSASSGRRMKVIKSSNGLRKGKQAAGRPKKTVTEWLAGVQYEERKPTGTKWVKSKNAKNVQGSRPPRVPANGAGMGRSVSIKKSTRKHGLKKDDDNVSVEVSVEDRDESSVYVV